MKLSQIDFERGVATCEEDVGQGVFRLYWQTRAAWGEYMTTIFKERFGIQVVHTSDITNTAKISFHAGYNGQAKQLIDKKFGSGEFDRAMNDVKSFRMERYRKHFPNG